MKLATIFDGTRSGTIKIDEFASSEGIDAVGIW
jgi:hypothetical protein